MYLATLKLKDGENDQPSEDLYRNNINFTGKDHLISKTIKSR